MSVLVLTQALEKQPIFTTHYENNIWAHDTIIKHFNKFSKETTSYPQRQGSTQWHNIAYIHKESQEREGATTCIKHNAIREHVMTARHFSRHGAKTRQKCQGEGRARQNHGGTRGRATGSERHQSMRKWNRSQRALKARLKPVTLDSWQEAIILGFPGGPNWWKSVQQLTLSAVTVDKRTNLFRKTGTVKQRPNPKLSHIHGLPVDSRPEDTGPRATALATHHLSHCSSVKFRVPAANTVTRTHQSTRRALTHRHLTHSTSTAQY